MYSGYTHLLHISVIHCVLCLLLFVQLYGIIYIKLIIKKGIYNMKIRKSKKKGLTADIVILKVVSLILCVFSILFLSLYVATGKNSIKRLTMNFVSSVDIDKQYYDFLYDYGFAEDICDKFFEDTRMINIISDVMGDKMSVLYKYENTYSYSKESCQADISKFITDFAEENGLNLSQEVQDSMVSVVCDVTGISQMFTYDSPAAYRDSIFNSDPVKYKSFDTILKKVSALSKLEISLAFIIMYIVCIIILIILFLYRNKDYVKLCCTICDTSVIPSFAIMGFSFGKLISSGKADIQNYIFGVLSFVGLMFFIVSVIVFVTVIIIGKKCAAGRTKDEEMNPGAV